MISGQAADDRGRLQPREPRRLDDHGLDGLDLGRRADRS
jgi:hypothetical protein